MAEKRSNVKDLRALTAADLHAKFETLKQELWQHRVKATSGSLQQTHLLRSLRRDIARIQTVLREQG